MLKKHKCMKRYQVICLIRKEGAWASLILCIEAKFTVRFSIQNSVHAQTYATLLVIAITHILNESLVRLLVKGY